MGQLVSLTCRLAYWILYTTSVLSFVLEHLELRCTRTNNLGAKLSLQYASKMKSLPKHPTHDAMFDNKLFDAKPNAIHTFELRSKHILTASKIDFSEHLNKPSYFVLPQWCIEPPKIVLDLVHLKKDRTDASVYKELFTEIRDRYCDYIPVCTARWNGSYTPFAIGGITPNEVIVRSEFEVKCIRSECNKGCDWCIYVTVVTCADTLTSYLSIQ